MTKNTDVIDAARAAFEPDDVEQGDLFFIGNMAAGGILGAAGGDATVRGRGRPPGSVNKSTLMLRDFILKRYQHPVIGMFEFFNRSPVDVAVAIAADFGVHGLEKPEVTLDFVTKILGMQLSERQAAARYVAAQVPSASEEQRNQAPVVFNFGVSVGTHTGGAAENGGAALDVPVRDLGIFGKVSEKIQSEIK